MGRKERRAAIQAAKKHNSRKKVKANKNVLIALAVVTVVAFLITIYMRAG
jgi:hypothetical protein